MAGLPTKVNSTLSSSQSKSYWLASQNVFCAPAVAAQWAHAAGFFVAAVEQSKWSAVQHQYQWHEIASLQSKPGFQWATLLLYMFILLWQKSEFPGISWSCQKKSYAHYFLNLSLIYHISLLKWGYCTNFFLSKLCMYWTPLSALLIHLCGRVWVCAERAFSCKSTANGKRNTF